GEFWQAVRYATSLAAARSGSETVSPIWLAARAMREPRERAKSLNFGEVRVWVDTSEPGVVQWTALLFPSLRTMFVHSGVRLLGNCIDHTASLTRHAREYLDVMMDPSFEFDGLSYRALASGLILADPQCAGIATDIVIERIESGTLDVSGLGSEIGNFLYSERSKPPRLAKALREIARVSDRHTDACRQVLEIAIARDAGSIPREFYLILETLNELLHAESIILNNPATLARLRRSKPAEKPRN
ncbi:MAG TPA: DUF6493 family protein, partial [Chroococcales cyanobacterium]